MPRCSGGAMDFMGDRLAAPVGMVLDAPPVAYLENFCRLFSGHRPRNSTRHTVGGRKERIVNDMHVPAGHCAARMAQHRRDCRL